jgi:hypothetical protein
MGHSVFGNLIKTGKGEILSCTLTDVLNGEAEFFYINFRKAVEKKCGILFFKYNGKIFYPYTMEFRLIDNNILHLIEELNIRNFKELSEGLESSFKKEENREVEFFPVIYLMQDEPHFSYLLEEFSFDGCDNLIEVCNA